MDIELGGTYEATDDGVVLRFTKPCAGPARSRGSMLNRSTSLTIFILLHATDITLLEAAEGAAADKLWILPGEAVRIPTDVTSLVVKTPSGSALLHYLES